MAVGCSIGCSPAPVDVTRGRPAEDGDIALAAPSSSSRDPENASPAAGAERVAATLRLLPAAGDDAPERPTQRSTGSRVSRRVTFPVRPGAINDVTFDDLELDMPLGTLFTRAMLTPRAAALDGQQVRIRGFIFAGGVFQQSGITSFPLVKNTACKFGPQGLAYCVILVDLEPEVRTDFTTYPVTVEGTLSVRPFNSGGFTWSVYHLQGRRVF